MVREPVLCLQVLLSDTGHLVSAAQGLSSSSAFPSLSEASQRQAPASTSASTNQHEQQQHPLKPYWEYLSFLFRRQPEPDPDQMLELSYRDYLQARRIAGWHGWQLHISHRVLCQAQLCLCVVSQHC